MERKHADIEDKDGSLGFIRMPMVCEYRMCHNLGSTTYQGYCNEDHQKQGREKELFMKIIEKVEGVCTIRQAKTYLVDFMKRKRVSRITSSSHCEVYIEPLHESDVCPKAPTQ